MQQDHLNFKINNEGPGYFSNLSKPNVVITKFGFNKVLSNQNQLVSLWEILFS